jgi:hypothetical protein
MKKILVGLMAVAAAGAFAGEAPYAKVVALNGNVTVASKSQMVPATIGMPLSQGASVLPGSNAKATVLFASGCQISVGTGQALSVDEAACAALNARARTVKGSAGSMATGGAEGLAGLPTVTIVAGGIVVAGVFYEVAIKDDNTPGGGGGGGGGNPASPGISNQ